MTLSLFLAESANKAPSGRTYPRRRDTADPEEDLDVDDRAEKVETVEPVEKHRPNGGQADRAGVGDTDGEGDDALVKGDEGDEES